jgi:uncharacterized Zn finger protein (UPF0148 family)
MARPLRTGPDDDLGLPWERMSDGRVWRLKRGRDYRVDSRAFKRAAEVAGERLGKIACLAPERIPRMKRWDEYMWVQFVDQEVLVGAPCTCGNPELVRLHPGFAHCPACGSRLKLSTPDEEERFSEPELEEERFSEPELEEERFSEPELEEGSLSEPPDGEEPQAPEPPAPRRDSDARRAKAIARGSYRSRQDERFAFEEYTDLRIVARVVRPRREWVYACAVDPLGIPVLVWVTYVLQDGARIPDPDDPSRAQCVVHRWPIPALGSVVKLDRVHTRSDDPQTARQMRFSHHPDDRRATGRLHKFSDVTLVYQEDLPGRERMFGHARDQDGTPTLIYVDYPLIDGTRMYEPDDPVGEIHFAYRWPTEPFGPVIDLRSLAR